jgi:peptidoglycan/xylan/chitin deacetylase (PgdA/CDA1 family)
MYHRVAPPGEAPELDPALLSATPSQFEEQMAFLGSRRRPISLPELLDVREGRARLPPSPVLVTFDDAYRDFAEHAWPIMQTYGVPVILFVPTAYPDAPDRAFWWDRLHHAISTARAPVAETRLGRFDLGDDRRRRHALRTLRGRVTALPHVEAMKAVDEICARLEAPPPPPSVLGWEELRALAREGVALAPHSRTHPLLHRVSREEAHEEITGSARDLEREIGSSPPVFAYPAGGYDVGVVRLVSDAGFAAAFTIERGSNDLRRADWLRLRRVNVGRRATLALVRAQLLPVWARVRRARAAGAVS